MPTLIVPFFASIISCLIMVYIIGTPIGIFTEALTSFLRSMGTSFEFGVRRSHRRIVYH